MTQQDFLRQIASGRAEGVWLLHGEEEPMKQETVRALKDALLDPAMAELNCVTLDSPAPDEVIEACETIPFLSERRLVIVRDFAPFRTKKADRKADADAEDSPARAKSAKKDPQLERMTAYLGELPMTTVLVFWEAGKVAKNNAMYKAVLSAGGEITCDKLAGDALNRWIVERFREEGKICPYAVAQALVFVSGREFALLQTEIRKLSAYVGDRDGVTEADVYEAATRTSEYSVFRMLDCVVTGSEAKALELLRLMLRAGESPVGILAMLLRQYRLLQMILVMQRERLSAQEISQRTGLSGFPLDQYIKQAAVVRGGEVRNAVRLILDAEFGFKSGRLPEKGLTENVVLQLLELRHRYRTAK